MRVRMVVAFVIVAALAVAAQTSRGGIVGTVADKDGNPIEEAKITATNTATGLSRDTMTAVDGDYALSDLPLGDYTLTVLKSGFQTPTMTGIHVTLSRTELVNITLAAGNLQQKPELNAEVPPVTTVNNRLGGSLEAPQISELPVNGRDFKKLLTVAPGTNMDPSGVSDSPGSFGVVAVNGNRGRANAFVLDGVDVGDRYHNQPAMNQSAASGIPTTLLPLDSIQELAVVSNADATYGRNSGSTVNLVTRSGSNDLHGSLFEYFRSDGLDARNYFNPAPNPKNRFHNHQFGASAGGAIFPDKTFWFLAYEGQREHVASPQRVTVPSLTQISANAPLCTGPKCINDVINNILSLNPWGPLPVVGDDPLNPASPHTAQTTLLTTNRLDNGIGKIDHHVFANDLVTARYFFGYGKQNTPQSVLGGNDVLPGYNTIVPTRVHSGALTYTHVFSPKLVADVRGGWTKLFEIFSPQDLSLNPALIGLNTTANPNDYGLPVIKVGGLATLGTNQSVPRGRTDTNWDFAADFSYNSGRHNWQMGVDYGRVRVAQYFDANHRGTLTFDTLADFLAGAGSSGTRTFGDTHRNTYQGNWAFYFQDHFRFTPRITVNVGVRWDYFGILGESRNLLSIFDPSVGLQQIGTTTAPSSLYPKDKNNFAPRLAAAYDVFGSGKTIVHAGWGLMYDQAPQDLFTGQIPFNTSNAGPAYNGVGSSPVLYGTLDPGAFLTGPSPCTPNQIVIPNTNPAVCTGPVFTNFTARDVFTVSQKLRTPYIQNYNLNLEQQVGTSGSVMVGYVGSLGRKLFRYRDINQPNGLTGVRPFDLGPFTSQGTQYRIVNQVETTANSSYNAVEAQFRTRNLRGFSSVLNYTYSHSIDNASDGQDYVPNASLPDNSSSSGGNRGNSNFDARHRFTWYFNYKLPEASVMRWLTAGWGLDGIVTLSTGMPFTVTDFNVINTTQLVPGTPVGEFVERPYVVGNPFSNTRSPAQFLNLSAFQAPCSVAPTLIAGVYQCSGGTPHYGSEGRNQFYGPRYRNFDFAFTKDTKITERVALQLRLDVFNVFNHPNFANPLLPTRSVDWMQNGIDATGRGQGFLPLTATPDVAAGNPYLGGGGPRNLEVGVRVKF
jgi:hypothetical protein